MESKTTLMNFCAFILQSIGLSCALNGSLTHVMFGYPENNSWLSYADLPNGDTLPYFSYTLTNAIFWKMPEIQSEKLQYCEAGELTVVEACFPKSNFHLKVEVYHWQ